MVMVILSIPTPSSLLKNPYRLFIIESEENGILPHMLV